MYGENIFMSIVLSVYIVCFKTHIYIQITSEVYLN